ncbi:MAG: hypothetical protein QW179_04510 [Candidatus Hadarchaeales archaeon]
MRIEFPFVEEKANILPTILRPLARVKLINKNMEIAADMYVDSGADITLIPYSVGIALGFSLKPEDKIRRIGGVGGGKISIVVRRLKMRIGGEESDVRVAWCMSEDVPLILGRLDIFDKFDVLFEGGKKTVFFKNSCEGIGT